MQFLSFLSSKWEFSSSHGSSGTQQKHSHLSKQKNQSFDKQIDHWALETDGFYCLISLFACVSWAPKVQVAPPAEKPRNSGIQTSMYFSKQKAPKIASLENIGTKRHFRTKTLKQKLNADGKHYFWVYFQKYSMAREECYLVKSVLTKKPKKHIFADYS